MFDAEERKATQDGRLSKPPSMDGANDGPFEGRPEAVRETITTRPGIHFAPRLSIRPARRTANTSLKPFLSPRTRLLASDSNAIARAKRLSPEMTGCVEAPFGILPPIEREISVVYWRSARLLGPL